MIYLYVKTHNKTGLKYLGKTTAHDPHNYPGSGKYWTRHLQKHGYDYSTEIIFESTDPKQIKEQGIYYSKKWDVVKSTHWANLKEEQGDGGAIEHSIESNKKRSDKLTGRIFSPDHRKKLSESGKGRKDTRSVEVKALAGLKASAKLKGRKKPADFGKKISEANLGKVMSEASKEKMRNAWTPERIAAQSERTKLQNKNRNKIICPYCKRQGRLSKKYHFENCKSIMPKLTKRNKSDSYSNCWIIKTPEGEIINVTNMRKFCRDHNLNNGTMTEVSLGNRKHHKGYTVISRL